MQKYRDDVITEDFPKGQWLGKWISPVSLVSGEERGMKSHTLLFRKTVFLEASCKRIPCRVTADSRYILWVNGMEAFRGPVRNQPRRLSYDMVDIAPYLLLEATSYVHRSVIMAKTLRDG